jgi:lysophospholipase L1-like esterase
MEWKSVWSYLPVNYNTNIGTISNITQRTLFENNLSGTKIKVKFSNLFSKKPIILEHVVIGKRHKRKAEIKDFKTITYQGDKKIVIESENEFYSDEIDFSVSFEEELVLSIYVKEITQICSVCSNWAARSWNTRFGLNGNYVYEQNFTETDCYDVYPVLQDDPNKADNIFGITEIKIYTDSDVKTVALFGDSITHMSYYSDALIEKLYKCYPEKITVVNRGLGGNRLLQDFSRAQEVVGGGMIFGAAGVKRFYHDIYDSDRPDFVIVLIGINDFMHPFVFEHYDEVVTVKEYQKGIFELISIAHENGSKILIGTITPFIHGEIDWFTQAETLRQKANEWIRNQRLSDGIIDFDMVTRKEDTVYMLEDYHLGDGLHPNAAGGKRMADAVPLEWFD